jgi:hypothetical protein
MYNLIKRESLRSPADEQLMQKAEAATANNWNGDILIEIRDGKATRISKHTEDMS